MDIVISMTETEERYNNRQIERMLDDQSDDLKEHIDITVAPLLTQVKKTNGRVGWMEKMVYSAMGAIAILTPIAVWEISQLISIRDSIQTTVHNETESAVQDALSGYVIKNSP